MDQRGLFRYLVAPASGFNNGMNLRLALGKGKPASSSSLTQRWSVGPFSDTLPDTYWQL